MPQRHFHVDTHDVGYHPDADNVYTYTAIDSAIAEVIYRAEECMNHAADLAEVEPELATRGQSFVQDPHTYLDEVRTLDKQIKEITDSQNLAPEGEDDDYNAIVARRGLLFVLEDGVAVIELTPCAEDTCETYRKDWIE